MSTHIRPATAADAPFIAWVMQAAARSHLPRGIWDLCFPGDEAERLAILAEVATTERVHFAHHSRFRILENDGEPACGLATYENRAHGIEHLNAAIVEVLARRSWSPEQMLEMARRNASFEAIEYPNGDGLWIVEWVATRPEHRGQGLVRRLLEAALEDGRAEGFETAQIGYLIGNVPARSAYEAVGFRELSQHQHPDFERDYGTSGVARMQRAL